MTARTNHRWTEEEREIVRQEYRNTHKSRRELAAKLGVTEYAVAAQVSRMGLGKRTDRRPWTPEEDELLRELIPRKSVPGIARTMGRSVNAVTVRAKRIQASRRVRDGWYTKREVCEILGMTHKWVQRRIESGRLKATWHHERQPQQDGSGSWHIEEKDLKRFIRRYPEELNGRNVDLVQVVAILAGVMPVLKGRSLTGSGRLAPVPTTFTWR